MASRMTEIGFQWGVKALQKKRAELAGEVGQLKLQLRDHRRNLRKVDDMLRILAPGLEPTKIPPKRAIRYLNLFRQGELGALIIAVLRAEDRPMTNLELAQAIFDRGGFDMALWTAIRRRVRANLAYMEMDGRAVKSGRGIAALWSSAETRTGLLANISR